MKEYLSSSTITVLFNNINSNSINIKLQSFAYHFIEIYRLFESFQSILNNSLKFKDQIDMNSKMDRVWSEESLLLHIKLYASQIDILNGYFTVLSSIRILKDEQCLLLGRNILLEGTQRTD